MASDTKQTPKDKEPAKEPASAAPVKAGGKNKAEAHAAAPKVPAAEGAAPAEGAVPVEAKPPRVKAARTVSVGIAHVNATFNNTQVSITDTKGQVLAWSSSGRMGFRGTRKSTAYAATMVAQEVARQISPY